jgi:hypothetical protein
MSRPVEKLVIEKRLDVAQYLRLAGGVKAMAAVIHGNALQLEAAGIASHVISLLYDKGHGLAAASQLPGGPDAGWACAQYGYSPMRASPLDLSLSKRRLAVGQFSATVNSW